MGAYLPSSRGLFHSSSFLLSLRGWWTCTSRSIKDKREIDPNISDLVRWVCTNMVPPDKDSVGGWAVASLRCGHKAFSKLANSQKKKKKFTKYINQSGIIKVLMFTMNLLSNERRFCNLRSSSFTPPEGDRRATQKWTHYMFLKADLARQLHTTGQGEVYVRNVTFLSETQGLRLVSNIQNPLFKDQYSTYISTMMTSA